MTMPDATPTAAQILELADRLATVPDALGLSEVYGDGEVLAAAAVTLDRLAGHLAVLDLRRATYASDGRRTA